MYERAENADAVVRSRVGVNPGAARASRTTPPSTVFSSRSSLNQREKLLRGRSSAGTRLLVLVSVLLVYGIQ